MLLERCGGIDDVELPRIPPPLDVDLFVAAADDDDVADRPCTAELFEPDERTPDRVGPDDVENCDDENFVCDTPGVVSDELLVSC